MTTSESRAKRASEAIALSRQEMPTIFSQQQLRKHLEKNKCPYFATLVSGLSVKGIITKKEKGQYSFTENKPVHFATLAPLLDHYESIRNKKPKLPKEKVTPVVTISKNDAEKAISYLKSLGYKILKPVTTFEEL